MNSPPNGITRDSRDNYQEMITEISQRRISLRKDFTWRSRGLPGALPYQATDQDAYRMAYRRIKKQSPNGIPSWMPTLHTRDLPKDYREANRYSTEAAYRDGHREVNQERTKAMIRMTFTEKRSTETLLNAELRDGEICKCNVLSGFPRAEARFYHGEYHRLLWCLCVRYGSMIFHPRPMQLASILPPPSGHRKCLCESQLRCQERKLTLSEVKTGSMWWSTFPYITLANSDDRLCRDSTSQNQSWTKLRVKAPMNPNPNSIAIQNHDYTGTDPRWQSTMNMMEKLSTEQRIFKRGRYLCLCNKVLQKSWKPIERQSTERQSTERQSTERQSTERQSTETCTEKSTEKSTEKPTEKSINILLKPPVQSTPMMSTGWQPKRTSKDDYQIKMNLRVNAESTSQCQVLMTTGCKIYSTEHAEALHRAQTALARLKLVSITILEKLTC